VLCPFCKVDKDRVVDSRAGDDGAIIRRRRECLACKRRFTTYERVEENPLRVIKKDGRRVPYERENIRRGIERACEKLNVSAAQIDAMIATIESETLEQSDREVPSMFLGELVMRELRKANQVAYVRFASVYKKFTDVGEFMEELEEVLKSKRSSLESKSGPDAKNGGGESGAGHFKQSRET
jgi:transcriptional repressor NrdR